MAYTVQIIQTIGSGMSKETSLKAYSETIEALLDKQPDVPDAARKDLFNLGVAFLKERGITVEWRREK